MGKKQHVRLDLVADWNTRTYASGGPLPIGISIPEVRKRTFTYTNCWKISIQPYHADYKIKTKDKIVFSFKIFYAVIMGSVSPFIGCLGKWCVVRWESRFKWLVIVNFSSYRLGCMMLIILLLVDKYQMSLIVWVNSVVNRLIIMYLKERPGDLCSFLNTFKWNSYGHKLNIGLIWVVGIVVYTCFLFFHENYLKYK